mgnify:CR=1 FL=1
MRTVRATCGLAFALLVFAGIASGDILYVPGEFGTIQEAVDAAQYGDEIEIAAGTYDDVTHYANVPDDSTLCVVVMKSGITLRGAGADQTFIDADSTGRGIFALACQDIVIEDLAVTRGFAEVYGAGILADSSNVVIRRVDASGNYDGAITLLHGAYAEISQCTMTNNAAKTGSGLDVGLECEAYVYQCEISNNGAPFAAGARLRGKVRLEECVFEFNETDIGSNLEGGGLLIKGGAEVLLLNCDISNNIASGNGGGIAITDEGTYVELAYCTIRNNVNSGEEGYGGGVYVGNDASAELRWCLIAGNSTTGLFANGGGVAADYSSLEMENCTLYANASEGMAPYGGDGAQFGFWWLGDQHSIQISHCIMTDSPEGQSTVFCSGSPGLLEITCCDVWNNAGGDEICDIVDESNFSADPLYCDAAGGNFFVQSMSPCAPGNHPGGPDMCGGTLIGAYRASCTTDVPDPGFTSHGLLLGNEPNPFQSGTAIRYQLAGESKVTLEVFDLSGRRVAVLQDGVQSAGMHLAHWDGALDSGEHAPAGVYFYQLRAGENVQGKRMLRLR